jgi:hypothetical protein
VEGHCARAPSFASICVVLDVVSHFLCSQACFGVMGHVCAIRAHTQEPRPNDQTLYILFTAFAPEGNCRTSRRTLFLFVGVFTDFLNANFGRIDPPKDSGACFLVPRLLHDVFFPKFVFALRKILLG